MNKTISGMILMIGMLVLVFNVQRIASLEPPATEWSYTYGGTSNDEAYCMIQTNDGGYALAGPSSSFGTGFSIVWLVKTDADGNQLWNKTFMEWVESGATSLIQTSDRGYALTGLTGPREIIFIKTDENGSLLCNRTYGTGTEGYVANSIVQTSDGGYAMAGCVFLAGNVYKAFMVKIDADGNQLWNKTYVVGAGYTVAFSVVQTGDGGYALAGHTGPTIGPGPGQNLDGFLIKTDAHGNVQWNRIYGGTGDDREFVMVQTGDGGYVLAGRTNSFGAGDYDSYLIRTDANGVVQWNNTYGGTGNEWAHSVIQTGNGGYALAGYTDSFGAGSQDFWLVKTDADGNMLWNKTCGGLGIDRAYSIVQADDSGYAIAGGTASFGAGGWDFWLVKLAPEEAIARVDIDPDTLNLKSKGEWITCYIELPEGYDVYDIDITSIKLNDTIQVSQPTSIGDYDGDGVSDLMVKFDRQAIVTWLKDEGIYLGEVTFTVTGTVADETFTGHDTVRIICPPSHPT